jgi:hypothetical protein
MTNKNLAIVFIDAKRSTIEFIVCSCWRLEASIPCGRIIALGTTLRVLFLTSTPISLSPGTPFLFLLLVVPLLWVCSTVGASPRKHTCILLSTTTLEVFKASSIQSCSNLFCLSLSCSHSICKLNWLHYESSSLHGVHGESCLEVTAMVEKGFVKWTF